MRRFSPGEAGGATNKYRLVFTFVWAFNLPADQAAVDEYAMPFRARGAPVHVRRT